MHQVEALRSQLRPHDLSLVADLRADLVGLRIGLVGVAVLPL